MNEKFNKNAKVEQLTNIFLSRREEKGLIVKDPLPKTQNTITWLSITWYWELSVDKHKHNAQSMWFMH